MDRRKFVASCGLGAAALAAGRSGAAGRSSSRAEYLAKIDRVVAGGPFRAEWDSLTGYRTPTWYEDAKFGIFIHWGVYSVPAFISEWYPREMYKPGGPVWTYHRMKWGPQSKFGYKDFIPMFTAHNFDPNAWAELFQAAGARYVVPVAEHHDGFAMYDCSFSDYTAAKMGPGRDVVGELGRAVRERGLVFGASSHRAEHWWFYNGGMKFKSDVRGGAYADLYGPAQPEDAPPDSDFLDDWLVRTAELVDRYQPQVLWFDWWIEQPAFEPYRQKIAAYLYNRAAEWGQGVALNYKNQAFPEGAAVLDLERAGVAQIMPRLWQTDTSTSFLSWGYIKPSLNRFKTPARLISDLVDIVSKNGVLLLNIGPAPDGTIPVQEETILREIGRWLEINGPAIHGTRPWKVFGEGPTALNQERAIDKVYILREATAKKLTAKDVRFTQKADALYAIVLGWPKDRRLELASLGRGAGLIDGEPTSVRLLGHDGPPLPFTTADQALLIDLPEPPPCDHAVAVEIKGVI